MKAAAGASPFAKAVTVQERIVTRIQGRAVRQQRELRRTLTELTEAKRRLRLLAQSFDTPEFNVGELEDKA